ncbi:lipocalin family protein [Zunongwangia sp. HGR-M22]|uniref:lipocalin family protein n=1 Tax=Zunongwangia sp. HGR-M22 TaxID=3015168 RepID=UPI0022DD813B|nr:lipocalin family protein [Zunongwangia sp. HGR-M22]WBL25752.1 lipocalin family protein [Zunongwangia sp. HGR-M22]
MSCSLFTSISCDTQDYGMYEVDRIVGSWKLVEIYNDNNQWTPAENTYSYTFNEDGTFISTRFPQCTIGSYSIQDDEIYLDFDCTTNRMIGIASTSSTIVEELDYEDVNIIFTPAYSDCDQGCRLKFKPIN